MNGYLIYIAAITLPLLAYILWIWYALKRARRTLSRTASGALKTLHYTTLGIFLGLMVLDSALGIRPQHVAVMIVICSLALISGIAYRLVGLSKPPNRLARGYFNFLSFLPAILFVLVVARPVLMSFLFARIFKPVSYVFFENSAYKIQHTGNGLFQSTKLEIFEKNLLWMHKIKASYEAQSTLAHPALVYYLIFYDKNGHEQKRLLLTED